MMQSERKRTDTSEIANRIVEAVNGLTEADLRRLGAWEKLAEVSKNTIFEAMDAVYDSIILHGQGFEAVADVYVTLKYDGDVSMGESFLANISGQMKGGQVTVDVIDVDVSGFYE